MNGLVATVNHDQPMAGLVCLVVAICVLFFALAVLNKLSKLSGLSISYDFFGCLGRTSPLFRDLGMRVQGFFLGAVAIVLFVFSMMFFATGCYFVLTSLLSP